MYGKDYDDADWEKLLDQLTFDDMDNLIANGGYGTPAVSSVGRSSSPMLTVRPH